MTKKYDSRFSLPKQEELHTYISIIILDKMLKKNRAFPVMLEGDDTHLEYIFDFLVKNGVMDVGDDSCYFPTDKGKNLYKTFLKKYTEFVKIYDVFCAVDLEEGIFGFEKSFDYEEDVFVNYLEDDRFVDLRVTVCEFKGINPFEMVFLSFLKEKRFREPKDRSVVSGSESWQHRTVYGEIFEEIVQILNLSLHHEELGYEDEEGVVSGEDVIKDVIEGGMDLARKIHEHQKRVDDRADQLASENQDEEEEIIETRVIEEDWGPDYFDPYYDPYYYSPVWDIALIGLILL
ncbi:hypothetical protein HOF92_04705 [bacterium]|jgi:hypothetical protein|nr:hypothetical protein [bacterium]